MPCHHSIQPLDSQFYVKWIAADVHHHIGMSKMRLGATEVPPNEDLIHSFLELFLILIITECHAITPFNSRILNSMSNRLLQTFIGARAAAAAEQSSESTRLTPTCPNGIDNLF